FQTDFESGFFAGTTFRREFPHVLYDFGFASVTRRVETRSLPALTRSYPRGGRDRRGAGRLGDHSREFACKERYAACHEHPAAHHYERVALGRHRSLLAKVPK